MKKNKKMSGASDLLFSEVCCRQDGSSKRTPGRRSYPVRKSGKKTPLIAVPVENIFP